MLKDCVKCLYTDILFGLLCSHFIAPNSSGGVTHKHVKDTKFIAFEKNSAQIYKMLGAF